MYSVYKHTTPNGKVYIGITSTSVEKRWNDGKGYARHPYFYNAIKKYGWDNIEHTILFENLTKEEACKKEKELINRYKSNQHDYGYNMTTGGESCEFNEQARVNLSNALKGRVVSDDVKLKISESEKGKQISDETRLKMSIAQQNRITPQGTIDNLRKMAKDRVGKPLSYETRKKISKSLMGHPSTTPKGKEHPNYGKHLSKETKEKISKALKSNISDETRQATSERFSKRVKCVETGEIFPSITCASKHYNISPSQLGAVCNKVGNYKTAGKLHWEFV